MVYSVLWLMCAFYDLLIINILCFPSEIITQLDNELLEKCRNDIVFYFKLVLYNFKLTFLIFKMLFLILSKVINLIYEYFYIFAFSQLLGNY